MMSDRRSKWIECGMFGHPWGIKGQVTAFWMSGACPVEVGRGEVYTRETGGDYVPYVVLASRFHNSRSVVSISGIKNPNEAKALTNKKIYVPENSLPKLKKNEYYCYQILGLDVVLKNGKKLGKVVHIFPTGSNDVYEVKPHLEGRGTRDAGRETILIPAIRSVVKEIDVENGKMIIEPMEGMLS